MKTTFTKVILLFLLLIASSVYAGKTKVEWYVPLMINSEDGLVDKHNVLGQMRESSDDFDRHDLVELRPFSTPFMTLNFFHPEWEKGDKHFASDYHDVKQQKRDRWVFQVESDDPERMITLYWKEPIIINVQNEKTLRKLKRLKNKMWLVDLKSKKVMKSYKKNRTESYLFSMEGEEVRQFMWFIGKKPSFLTLKKYASDTKASNKPASNLSSSRRAPVYRQNLWELQPPGHSKY